jgi:hypothetical protein
MGESGVSRSQEGRERCQPITGGEKSVSQSQEGRQRRQPITRGERELRQPITRGKEGGKVGSLYSSHCERVEKTIYWEYVCGDERSAGNARIANERQSEISYFKLRREES